MEMSMLSIALVAQFAVAPSIAQRGSPPDLASTVLSETSATRTFYGGLMGCGGDAVSETALAPKAGVRGNAQLPVVTFVVPGCHDVPIVLPDSAVLSDSRGTFVYIVDHNDAVARRDVVTGQVSDRGVAIVHGLEGDERVVQAAGPFLSPGETVRPEGAQPTPKQGLRDRRLGDRAARQPREK